MSTSVVGGSRDDVIPDNRSIESSDVSIIEILDSDGENQITRREHFKLTSKYGQGRAIDIPRTKEINRGFGP